MSSQVVCRPLTVQLIHYSDWDDNRSLCLFVGVPVTRFIHSFLPLAFLFALQISFIRFFLHFKCHFTASICDCPSVSLIVHPSVCLWWLLKSVTWIFYVQRRQLCLWRALVRMMSCCECLWESKWPFLSQLMCVCVNRVETGAVDNSDVDNNNNNE